MTVKKLLEQVDHVKENEVCDEVKIGWIGDLDGRVQCELLKRNDDELTLPVGEEDELSVPDAYCGVYLLYLIAMIELSLGNYDAYIKLIKEHEYALEIYAKHIIRTR